jgi:hypothetical protein
MLFSIKQKPYISLRHESVKYKKPMEQGQIIIDLILQPSKKKIP